MDRKEALQLLADAARSAQDGPVSTGEHTVLQFLAWVPRTIQEKGLEHATGVIIGVSRMTSFMKPKLNAAIFPALFIAEEVLRHDGLIPEQQVRDTAAALAKLSTQKAA